MKRIIITLLIFSLLSGIFIFMPVSVGAQESWEVPLSITSNPSIGSGDAIFGIEGSATSGFDEAYDDVAPPLPVGDGILAYFYYPDNSPTELQKLGASYVPPADTLTWTLKVVYKKDGPTSGDVTIGWQASAISAISSQYSSILLRDKDDTATLADLKAVNFYTYTATVGDGIPLVTSTFLVKMVRAAVIPGDANGDGYLDSTDITTVERIIVGLDPFSPGADANQDGKVNALDITKTERLVASL